MIRWRRTHRNPTVQTTASGSGDGYFAAGEVLHLVYGNTEEAMRELDALMMKKYPSHDCESQRCAQWHESPRG
jgi:hypothetical protein